jgi:hypothetical protein
MLIRPPLKKLKKKSPILLKRRRKKMKKTFSDLGVVRMRCVSLLFSSVAAQGKLLRRGFQRVFFLFFYGFLIDNLIAKVTYTYL